MGHKIILVLVRPVVGIFLSPNEGKEYTWYIGGIHWQLGDYMLPIPPFTRNLKNQLSGTCFFGPKGMC